VLYGREAELARIEAMIASAQEGNGGALAVTGWPGVGKTALLLAAAERAPGMRTLSTTGLEAESTLPFSALAEIAEHLLDRIGELLPPQAAAIEGALAIGPPAPGDRFAASAGFLGLLAAAARDRPLLLLVDDAHWLDRASSECLAFAARRLDDKAIGLLVAVRTGEPHAFAAPGIAQISLAGLDRKAARALLASHDSALPSSVAESLLDSAAGNPLALIELPAVLTADQRAGRVPLDEPLPPGVSLQRAFEGRIARLPDGARRSLLVAAAAFTPAIGPVVAACEALGIGRDALEAAEADGIVALSPERIEFSHPLLRGAVYQDAPAAERRRAHRALAEHTDEDARAWHLAAAALGPDEEAAGALEAAGYRAAARGAHAAASEALERAARLSADGEARSRRLFATGLEAALGGAFDRGAALLELVTEIEDPVMRASARRLLAMVTLNAGVRGALDNHRLLTEEAERLTPVDPCIAATLHSDAAVTAAVAGDCRLVLGSAERAAAILPADADATSRCQVLSMLGTGLSVRGRTEEARQALDEAGRLLPEVSPLSPAAQSISLGLGARLSTGQEEVLRREALSLARAARDAQTPGLLPYYGLVAADSAYRTGDWSAAEREIAESVAIAEESGQGGPLSIGLVIAARLHAAMGHERTARSEADRGMALALPVGYGSSILWGRATLGFLELGLDRVPEAIAELEETQRLADPAGLEDPVVVPWAPDLVEAYARAGRSEDARRICGPLTERARNSGTPLAGALAARAEGLVADRGFDEPFERALVLHGKASSPFEHARTLLAFGSRLHRARRRVDARARLRLALEIFQGLGAAQWAERTEAELKAAGAIERVPAGDPNELTAQEVRVALSVARGATNREVAAQLYLSPKTIEFHLGRIYRKLGIRSRTALAALVADGALGNGPASPEEAATANRRVAS
jgi:DNA-binding CsgD family transcriptional regulator